MAALRPGQLLEGTSYQVVREIGAGGMGVVYEIEHVRLKKRYVAKVIHETIKNDESARRRMEREAQVLAGLSHPYVVQVHDVGTTSDGTHYFVMEKLDGVDLRRFMKRAMPRARALSIIADVLEALDYVHKKGIVHRDIKPENIFLAEQPQGTVVTKVLDFGIVHIFDGDGRISHGRITKTGGFAGTLYYAAPEQMQGKPPGPSCDVYAAGLVLFELLAGKGPFDDDPGVGLSRCFKPAPHLVEFAPTVTRELGDVIARALLQEPSQRPPASWLAAEIRRLQGFVGADPTPPVLSAPAADEVGAEVDDLLNAMPVHSTGKDALGRVLGPSAPGPASDPAFAQTNVPPTPIMANAPPRHLTPPEAATMASAQLSEPPPPHQPTNIGLHPAAPPPNNNMMMPTQGSAVLPAYQTAPQAAPQRYSTPGGAPPISPRVAPLGMTMGMASAETAPGIYATVDQIPTSSPSPNSSASPPTWAPIAGITAAILLALGLIGGALIYRYETTPKAEMPPPIVASSPKPDPAPIPPPDPPPPPPAISIASATPTTPAPAPPPPPQPGTKTTAAKPSLPTPPTPPRPAASSKGGDGYLKEL